MPFVISKKFLSAAILAAATIPSLAIDFPASGPTVPGTKARLRYGLAFAPANAPLVVKRAIWAANQFAPNLIVTAAATLLVRQRL